MITQLFLGIALLGTQWVLWLLVALSVFSVAVIIERRLHFRKAASNLERRIIEALQAMPRSERAVSGQYLTDGFVADARIEAERRLGWLATIGSNAPFVGLLGTVLGIIRAFHDLSLSGAQGPAVVSSGISEALVATAVGIFVAIPAVAAYNHFQRKVKDMLLIAERAKSAMLADDWDRARGAGRGLR